MSLALKTVLKAVEANNLQEGEQEHKHIMYSGGRGCGKWTAATYSGMICGGKTLVICNNRFEIEQQIEKYHTRLLVIETKKKAQFSLFQILIIYNL